MKILITGKGTGGSWQCRGVQPAEAMGATCKPNATLADMRSHDVVVLVKRPTDRLADDLRNCGRPFVHDVVDAWPQRAGNEWREQDAREWLSTLLEWLAPDAVICATKRMQRDVGELAPGRVITTTIYHHARPAYLEAPRRKPGPVCWVGYEGGANYLGRYRAVVEAECARRHWQFNPNSIVDADIALCLRDCSGYAPRHFKSQVKLANAQALGLPALCSPECGYQETSTGGVIWIESPADIRAAFDSLSDEAHYAKVATAVDKPPTLDLVAAQYKSFLEAVCSA